MHSIFKPLNDQVGIQISVHGLWQCIIWRDKNKIIN